MTDPLLEALSIEGTDAVEVAFISPLCIAVKLADIRSLSESIPSTSSGFNLKATRLDSEFNH